MFSFIGVEQKRLACVLIKVFKTGTEHKITCSANLTQMSLYLIVWGFFYFQQKPEEKGSKWSMAPLEDKGP